MRHSNKYYLAQIACMLFSGIAFNAQASSIDNPCGGTDALFNIVDRPTVGDSACTVPYRNAVIELGYQYQQLTGAGYQQNFPTAQFRLGLPYDNEFTILLPNYIHQTVAPKAGFSATTIGLKHEVAYAANWVASAEAFVIPASGSDAFGSNGTGSAVAGILNYNINDKFSITAMLALSNQTESYSDGGGRFTTLIPDLVLSYVPHEKFLFYGEVYGSSKTSPNETSGFNCDTGALYLLAKNIAIDAEVGQRISGNLIGFEHYVGTGVAIMM